MKMAKSDVPKILTGLKQFFSSSSDVFRTEGRNRLKAYLGSKRYVKKEKGYMYSLQSKSRKTPPFFQINGVRTPPVDAVELTPHSMILYEDAAILWSDKKEGYVYVGEINLMDLESLVVSRECRRFKIE